MNAASVQQLTKWLTDSQYAWSCNCMNKGAAGHSPACPQAPSIIVRLA